MLIPLALSGFFQKFGMGGGYAQGTGTSAHGPVPPDPEEQSRLFVPFPVEQGDVEAPKSIARQRQFARLQQMVIRRRFNAAVWLLRRKISRLHRVYPARNIAAFYLLVAGVLCVVLARTLFVPPAPPDQILPIAEREKNLDEAFSQLTALISARNFAEARAMAMELEAYDPDDIRLLVAKGVLASAQGDSQTARALFGRADKLAPGNLPVIVNMAENEFVTGHYKEAEVQYRRILAEQPKNLRAIFRLYLCARLQQEPGDAARYFDLAAPSANSLEWFYIRAADALFEGRTEEGRGYLDKARALFGDKTAPYDKTLVRLGLIPAK